MKLSYKLLYCIIFISSITLAQDSENFFNPLNKVAKVPKSPEAAGFEKVTGGVNSFTGTPNISVPLYTLEGKEISLPISLTYDASGIKVDQIASQVGLGWNLSSGGVITRNVNGSVDDYVFDGRAQRKVIYNTSNHNLLEYLFDSGTLHGDHNNTNLLNSLNVFYEQYQGVGYEIDVQPDTYTISVPGLLSATFVIDYTPDTEALGYKKIYCIDNPYLKINSTYTGDYISEFEVINTDGTKLTFADIELVVHHISEEEDGNVGEEYTDEYVSAWYLTKIESVNEIDTFNFLYDTDEWTRDEESFPVKSIDVKANTLNQLTASTIRDRSYASYRKHQKRLKEINSNNFKVVLNSDSRLDLGGSKRISELEIFSRTTDEINPQKVKTIKFNNNSYFGESTGGELISRLKLDGIKIYNSDESKAQHYSFDYESPELVPSRLSKSIDFWGYFNGKSNGNLTIDHSLDYSDIGGYFGFAQGAVNIDFGNPTFGDRRPDFEKAKVGALSKITYPTGGSVTYEYEMHKGRLGGNSNSTLKIVGGLRLKSSTLDTNEPIAEENKSYSTYYLYDDMMDLILDPVIKGKILDGTFIPEMNNYSSGFIQQHLEFHDAKTITVDGGGTNKTSFHFLTNNKFVDVPNDITYSDVTTFNYVTSSSSSGPIFEGATITKYYNGVYDLGDYYKDHVRPFNNINLDYGNVNVERVIDSDFNLVSETTNEYTVEDIPNTNFPTYPFGLIIYPNTNISNIGYTGGTSGCPIINNTTIPYSYNMYFTTITCNGSSNQPKAYSLYENVYNYGYTPKWLKLNKSKTVSYESGLSVGQETETYYTYGSLLHVQPTEIIVDKNSKGRKSKTEIVYAEDWQTLQDYPQNSGIVLNEMLQKNRLNIPVDKTVYYESNVPDTYIKVGKERKLFNTFIDETSINKHFLSKVQVSKGTSMLEDRIIYESYDKYGNLTELYYPLGTHHIYVWGYKGALLIAEIKNASFNTMPSTLKTTIDSLVLISDNENSLSEENQLLNDFKNLLYTHNFFKNSQITTYIHDPGIGVKSITDGMMNTIFYKYDTNNMLEYTLDKDDKVLTKNSYNFRVNNQ